MGAGMPSNLSTLGTLRLLARSMKGKLLGFGRTAALAIGIG